MYLPKVLLSAEMSLLEKFYIMRSMRVLLLSDISPYLEPYKVSKKGCLYLFGASFKRSCFGAVVACVYMFLGDFTVLTSQKNICVVTLVGWKTPFEISSGKFMASDWSSSRFVAYLGIYILTYISGAHLGSCSIGLYLGGGVK